MASTRRDDAGRRARPARWVAVAALSAAMLGLAGGCSSVRQLRPLGPGESAINLSLGGPVTKYVGEAYLPLPLLSIGYNLGLLKTLDLEVGFDLTHTLFKVPKLDFGVNWRPWTARRWRPSLIVTPKCQLATNFESIRAYPALSLTAPWCVRDMLYPYLGIENWFDLHREREDGAEQKHHWLIAPYVGLGLSHGHWQYQIEMRWYTPNLSNEWRAAKNVGFGEHGIIGFFLGIGRTFGGRRAQAAP